jgi:hypothetical protein
VVNIRSKLLYCYVILLILYSAFTLLSAPTSATLAQYHLSVDGIRLINVTIIVLVAAIWFVGFYGYTKLRSYSQLIRGGKDAKPIAWLTRGIFVLALWLPVSMTVSSILTYIGLRHAAFMAGSTVINNYISLLIPLLAFILISKGARGLSDLVRQRPSFGAINVLAIILVYIGLIDYHLVAATHDRTAVYHLSIWLIITTLVAPYIYMWFIGLLSTYEVYRYRIKVQGIVYRQCWTLLTLGLGLLIVTSIGFQYLSTISNRLNHLPIYWLLIIIYVVLTVLSAGFILIAMGTRKLRRIEEV